MQNKTLHIIGFTLLAIGGLNWGLVGLFQLDLVDLVLGSWPWLARLVYTLVGIATVYVLVTHRATCEACKAAPAHRMASQTNPAP